MKRPFTLTTAIFLATIQLASAAQADEILVSSGGGALQDAQREAFFKPTEKSSEHQDQRIHGDRTAGRPRAGG